MDDDSIVDSSPIFPSMGELEKATTENDSRWVPTPEDGVNSRTEEQHRQPECRGQSDGDIVEINTTTSGSADDDSKVGSSPPAPEPEPPKKQGNDEDSQGNEKSPHQRLQQQPKAASPPTVHKPPPKSGIPISELWKRYDLSKGITDDELAELRVVGEEALLARPVKYDLASRRDAGRSRYYLLGHDVTATVGEKGGTVNDDDNSEEDDTDEIWNRMFDRLVEYQKDHGHTAVVPPPPKGPRRHDSEFAEWAQRQRQAYREIVVSKLRPPTNSLEASRMDRLRSVGFVWSYGEFIFAWQEQYHAATKKRLPAAAAVWTGDDSRSNKRSRTTGNDVSPLAPTMNDWMETQRYCLHHHDGISKVTVENCEALFAEYE